MADARTARQSSLALDVSLSALITKQIQASDSFNLFLFTIATMRLFLIVHAIRGQFPTDWGDKFAWTCVYGCRCRQTRSERHRWSQITRGREGGRKFFCAMCNCECFSSQEIIGKCGRFLITQVGSLRMSFFRCCHSCCSTETSFLGHACSTEIAF